MKKKINPSTENEQTIASKNDKSDFLPDMPYRITEVGHRNMFFLYKKHRSIKPLYKKVDTSEIEPELKLFLEKTNNTLPTKSTKKARGITDTPTPTTDTPTTTPTPVTPTTDTPTTTPTPVTPTTDTPTTTPTPVTPTTDTPTTTPTPVTPTTDTPTTTPPLPTPTTDMPTTTPTPVPANNTAVKPTIELIKNVLVQMPLNKKSYLQEVYPKKQIYLHHTISWGNPTSAYNTWVQNQARIATFAIIAGKPINKPNAINEHKDGEIYQCFSSKHWAFHLGVKNNIDLERYSIGIELANWGGLVMQPKSNGKLFTVPPIKNNKGVLEHINLNITEKEVIHYEKKYKDYYFYEKYTDKQLESLRKLLLYLCEVYQIPKKFNPNMFEVNKNALKGERGIWTHTSVRADKSDCHPQPELIQMLKSL